MLKSHCFVLQSAALVCKTVILRFFIVRVLLYRSARAEVCKSTSILLLLFFLLHNQTLHEIGLTTQADDVTSRRTNSYRSRVFILFIPPSGAWFFVRTFDFLRIPLSGVKFANLRFQDRSTYCVHWIEWWRIGHSTSKSGTLRQVRPLTITSFCCSYPNNLNPKQHPCTCAIFFTF